MSATIKTTYQENEVLPANFTKDAAWIGQNKVKLFEEYGDCVLLVYHEQIIGHGATVEEAILEAESSFAHETGLVTPVVKYLSSPYRIGVMLRKKA